MKVKSPKSKERLGELLQSITRRDPSKRQIKPINTEHLFLDDLEDESDDEYVYDGKDDDDGSDDSESDTANDNDSGSSEDSDSEEEDDDESVENRNIEVASTTNIASNETVLTKEIKVTAESYPVEMSAQNINDFENIPLKAEKRPIPIINIPDQICMLCLGELNNVNDEIIECDACKVVVHEDCHKVYDDVFLSSSASSSDTDPWFCEPCLANVEQPHCELCPNLGGVFKRTDNNRWVHLLCALYTPGVAFNYSESLTEVTLTELPPKEWSSRECSLCDEKFFAWTGICISCDAGLCKNYFHVTCAQKQGLLAEPAYEDNPTDPFFAQCRQHTDKAIAKGRRRNYLTSVNRCKVLLQLAEKKYRETRSPVNVTDVSDVVEDKSIFTLLDDRLKRKLEYFRNLYRKMLEKRQKPYTWPTKLPLFLENSPVAMRMFVAKAMAVGLPMEFTGNSAVNEATKSTGLGCPIFCPDFISYVLEREKKIEELAKRLSSLESTQRELQLSDANVSHSYNSLSSRLNELNSKLKNNKIAANSYVQNLGKVCSTTSATGALSKLLTSIDISSASQDSVDFKSSTGGCLKSNKFTNAESRIGSSLSPTRGVRGMTRKSLLTGKLSVAQRRRSIKGQIDPLSIVIDADHSVFDMIDISEASQGTTMESENIIHQCHVCTGLRDQHLMTMCETCKKTFHIACLDPPLARVPRQSKLFSWQCSACTKAVVSSTDQVAVDVDAPRKLRRVSTPTLSESSLGQLLRQSRQRKPPRKCVSTLSRAPNVVTKRTRKSKLIEDKEISEVIEDIAPINKIGVNEDQISGVTIDITALSPSNQAKGKKKSRKRKGRPPVRRVEAESYPVEMVLLTPSEPTYSPPPTPNQPPEKTSLKEPSIEDEEREDDVSSEDELEESGSDTTSTSSSSTDGTSENEEEDEEEKEHYNENDEEKNEQEAMHESPVNSQPSPSQQISTPSSAKKRGLKRKALEDVCKTQEPAVTGSEDELSNLRGSKVKFIQIRGHESPTDSQSIVHDEPERKCYVVCQNPKKSPAITNFKMKIKKIE